MEDRYLPIKFAWIHTAVSEKPELPVMDGWQPMGACVDSNLLSKAELKRDCGFWDSKYSTFTDSAFW